MKLATRVPIINMYTNGDRKRARESEPNGERTPGTGKRRHHEMLAASPNASAAL